MQYGLAVQLSETRPNLQSLLKLKLVSLFLSLLFENIEMFF